MEEKGPFLVTLRVDSLKYDKLKDEYIVSLQDCILNDEKGKKQTNSDTIDPSKIIRIEKDNTTKDVPPFQMQQNEEKQIKKKLLTATDGYAVLFWSIYILLAVFFFMIIEDDTFTEALYFRVVTSFTIGYGDIVPKTTSGKIINSIFIIVDIVKWAYIDLRMMTILFNLRTSKFPNKANNNLFVKIINTRKYHIYAILILSFFILTGTLIMSLSEGYSFIDSLQWNVVTLSCVGYGDAVPATTFGQFFCVLYIIVGYIIIFLYFAIIVFDKLLARYMDKQAKKIVYMKQTEMSSLM
eukprot:167905_1